MSNISYKILITFLQKMHFFRKKFFQKCDVLFRPKFRRSSNYQQQQPQLPFTMHKRYQDPSKRVQIVNFRQKFTCNFTPKVTITDSSYETPDKNSENASANVDRNIYMVPNEKTCQGLSTGSKPKPAVICCDGENQ